MECLASFVVLFVLPVAAAALVVAWRARSAARRAASEATELASLVRTLSAQLAAARAVAPAQTSSSTAGGAPSLGPPSTPVLPARTAAADSQVTAEPVGPASAARAPSRDATTPPAAAVATTASSFRGGRSEPPEPPVPPRPSLEERLGARLPVWIGAVALVLAAAFLVKYSVDQGWIGPTVRVTLGALFGVALLAGGELLRRSSATVAQGLTAAGIAVLFVVELAALHLYHLIGPTTGFALLALTTATAVVLALLHGPIVALLGLVGGFLTPVLVSTEHPNARLLFGYLALLQAGLFAVSRRRTWAPLAGLNLAAALAWACGWALGPAVSHDATVVGIFLLVTVAAALAASLGGARLGVPLGAWMRTAAAGGALVVGAVLAVRTDFALVEWGFVGLLAAACLVLARLSQQLPGLGWLGAGTVCLLLGGWAQRLTAEETTRFLAVAGAALLLLAGGGWALRRGAHHPAQWAALAAVSSLAVDLVAWHGAGVAKVDLPWGWIELSLAAAWILLALPVARRRETTPGGEESLAAAAAVATALVSLAVPMELDRQWIAVAWAVEVAALVWLAGRLRVPLLAHLAAVLTVLVGARLLLNPEVLHYPTGPNPYVSWLLYGYGAPIAALAVAAVLARRQGRQPLAAGVGGVAVALGAALLALSVRQAFHPGLAPGRVEVAEWGSLTTLWLTLACGLLAAASRTRTPPTAERGTNGAAASISTTSLASHPYPEVRWGGMLLAALAVLQALLGQGIAGNPLLFHLPVGMTRVLNALLLAYGVPAALLVVAVALERLVSITWKPSWPLLRLVWSAAALLLLFLLVTFEVRQAFRGTYLDGGAASAGERYAYSAAWILLATALLVGGLLRRSRSLRVASLPVMVLAVGKVFLYDTSNLSDLYRVFSFLGLGVSLLLLAWLYQRFVFRPRPELP